jgi:hypothetical protein
MPTQAELTEFPATPSSRTTFLETPQESPHKLRPKDMMRDFPEVRGLKIGRAHV